MSDFLLLEIPEFRPKYKKRYAMAFQEQLRKEI